MGLMVDGVWHDRWYDTASTKGRFVRGESQFRDTVEPGGRFEPARGRYHLYVARACPWAHRATIYRKLKGLSQVVGLSVVHPDMLDQGWVFTDDHPDALYGSRALQELYRRARPDYSGRVTVPVLWDKATGTIVNNESAEIIRIFDRAFAAEATPDAPLARVELAPDRLRPEIDAVNAEIYEQVNNGVYRAGFATTQEAYEEAVTSLFSTLDALDERLGRQRFLLGDRLTEADWRLFTTLVRFDVVYHGHFKCNLHRLADYANLSDHTRALFQFPGVRRTIDFAAIKRHYYYSHATINPHRIVPLGPVVDFHLPHSRGDWREWLQD